MKAAKRARVRARNSAAQIPNRYSAILLFQFRVSDERAGALRLCEQRVVVFRAGSAREALRLARRHGREARSSFINPNGDRVRFEFVGVTDLIDLRAASSDDEVWFDICRLKTPMERRAKLVPKDSELNAIRGETRAGRHRRAGRGIYARYAPPGV